MKDIDVKEFEIFHLKQAVYKGNSMNKKENNKCVVYGFHDGMNTELIKKKT